MGEKLTRQEYSSLYYSNIELVCSECQKKQPCVYVFRDFVGRFCLYCFREFLISFDWDGHKDNFLMIQMLVDPKFRQRTSKKKTHAKKERSKMSLRLRYSILVRDGFKCKSCGVSASKKKLEIDHIIPVSRGGISKESNLQALCVTCNRGKYNIVV